MGLAEEIKKLEDLRAEGLLSEEEFEKAKASLITTEKTTGEKIGAAVDSFGSEERNWAVLIHVSQLSGYVLPVAGWIVTVVLWFIKKDTSAVADLHGRICINWLISQTIYLVVAFALVFVLVGFVLVPAIVVCGVVFPIIGAIKAHEGEAWRYPLSITFLPVE